ncbi:hypothetical protein MJL79_15215, partial [Salmonella enterica subsp. enterica serovar Montevideo]|nr:hypothetical protein [Salmonella enterica subsp. enterica serovar Montevideo]
FSNINTFSTTLSNRVKKQSIACAQNRICPANYKQATFGTFWNHYSHSLNNVILIADQRWINNH